MSFLDYLKDHRGQFIDHRVMPPARPSPSALDIELTEYSTDDAPASAGGSRSGVRRRLRRSSSSPNVSGTRFRHVRPIYAPSPYSDPLPYEEPWERAFR